MATSSSDASKYFDSYRPSSATASIRSNSSRPKSKSSSRPGSRSESVTNGRSSPRFFLDNSNDHIYFDFHNSDIWPSTGIRSRKLKGRRGKAQLPIRSSSTKKRPKSIDNSKIGKISDDLFLIVVVSLMPYFVHGSKYEAI